MADANQMRDPDYKPPLGEAIPLGAQHVLAMFAGYSCILAVFYGLLTWMPSYLHKTYGFNIATTGGATCS